MRALREPSAASRVERVDVVAPEVDAEGRPHRGDVLARGRSRRRRSPTVSASTRRRLMPRSRAAAATSSAAARAPRTVTVSKNGAVGDVDAAVGAARRRGSRRSRWTRRAIARRPVRAVVDGVHRGDDGEQHLRGADVAGRLLAADVLLAGLQRQPVGRRAVGVDRDADQPAGQLPLEAGADGEVAGVRAAEAERHAEALGGADGDVGADLAGRAEQGQREQVGGDDDQGAARRARPRRRRRGRGRARTRPGTAPARRRRRRRAAARTRSCTTTVEPERRGAGADDVEGLRQHVGVDDERRRRASAARCASAIASAAAVASSSSDAPATGRPVRSSTIGLEVEQRLEPALADLGLVGRVGGVPGRVLQHVAPDHRRRERAVVAQPDHRGAAPGCGRPARAARRRPRPRSRRAAGPARASRGCWPGRRRRAGRPARRSRARRACAAGRCRSASADVPRGERCGVLEIGRGDGRSCGHGAPRRVDDGAPSVRRLPRLSGATPSRVA